MSDRIKELRTALQTLSHQAKALYAELEAKGGAASAEEIARLEAMIEDGRAKRRELERLEGLAELEQVQAGPVQGKAVERPEGVARRPQSWGQVVLASEQYKSARQRGADGRMDRVAVPGGVKALYGSDPARGGVLVIEDTQPDIIDIARQRPLSLLNLINVAETSSDTVRYIELSARTNNAAPVPEWDGSAFGLKPESDLTFNEREAPVKWIATWIPVHRQLLEDAPRLRDMVDQELTYMIRAELERQILVGNGTGSNFTGMLNWAGIQTRVMSSTAPSGRGQTTSDTRMTTLRRAITDIRLEFYEATAVVLNPADAEDLELTEYSANRYANAFDPVTMRVWRVPVVETPAMPAGTALVGNLQLAATLWDRSQVEILVGQPNDYFLRNAVALLAELRAAFAVVRPRALEKVTFGS